MGDLTPASPPGDAEPGGDRLPIAVRAHAVPDASPAKPRPRAQRVPTRPARHPAAHPVSDLLVFDTETRVDAAQPLTFGAWRYYQQRDGAWVCVQEGLLYADELPREDPAGMAVLRRIAETSRAATTDGVDRPLDLASRSRFVERVLFACAWHGHARVVGFNLPFDLSRVAIASAEGRGRNLGGFSLILAAGNPAKGYAERRHRPRVRVKHVNSYRAQISFAGAIGGTGWLGDFVDLRTLAFALTGRGHSLQSASRAFGLPGKANPGGHGKITPSYVAYCRQDVAATARLYFALEAELASLGLPLTAPYAYSPASLAKAALDGMGVTPLLSRWPDTPGELPGVAMSAFYGGRAECRYRRGSVPVRLVDFTSTYPSLFALMDLWRYVTAGRIEVRRDENAQAETQALLDSLTVDAVFDPKLWPRLVGFARIRPAGHVLPVRAQYDLHATGWGIGVNPLTLEAGGLWYALPDLADATLLTGRAPELEEVILLDPVGQVAGLTPLRLPGGRLVDPRQQDPFRAMTEERQLIRRDQSLEIRARIQLFLKITSNAGAYGIWAEYNREDLPAGERRKVTVYSHDEPFTDNISAPEEPGRFCYPPLAAVITAGARLLLGLLERCVTDLGGSWAIADTDSMAIIATETGGPITTGRGRRRKTVHALSHDQVDGICDRFAALNPYDQTAVPGSILKVELDAYCYAIAAKRYALFRYDDTGRPRLVPDDEHAPCSHGLGHLINPIDPDEDPEGADWIRQMWEHELARVLTPRLAGEPPAWYHRPALARINATSPRMLAPLRRHSTGKTYREQIKPFNFLMFAPGAQPPAGSDAKQIRLVSPYSKASQWLKARWADLRQPDTNHRISTDPMRAGRAIVPSLEDTIARYLTHPEPKATDQHGTACQRASEGQLHRRPVTAESVSLIGKEANQLDERETGLITGDDFDGTLLVYRDSSQRLADVIPGLRAMGLAALVQATGLSDRRLRDILAGRTQPRRSTEARLIAAAQGLPRR